MKDKVFFDTNLWIYLYSHKEKGKVIKDLIYKNFDRLIISVQILGELYSVLIRKNLKTEEDSEKLVLELIKYFNIVSVDKICVSEAIRLNIKYKYSYWDSLILATSLYNSCSILYSEDLHHNQIIENNLLLLNPFKI